MNLRYSKKFAVSFRKLAVVDKSTVVHALELFQEHPFDASLRNHALRGKMSGKRAIVIDHDLRIVFTERGDYQDVTLLDVGSHADVYRH
jgi:addiction module RelE/StbE family toxin